MTQVEDENGFRKHQVLATHKRAAEAELLAVGLGKARDNVIPDRYKIDLDASASLHTVVAFMVANGI